MIKRNFRVRPYSLDMISSAYFAHPITMYDTPVEKSIAASFQARFPECHVENPNQPQHSEGYQKGGMDYFVDLCNQQDGVFFSSFADGTIGAGVAKEVQSFVERQAPVYYFDARRQEFVPTHDLAQFPVLNVDDTRAHIRQEKAWLGSPQNPYQSIDNFHKSVDVTA